MKTHEGVRLLLRSLCFVSIWGYIMTGLGCQSGWMSYSGYCYRFYNTPTTFDNAEAACVVEGAHLVSITGQGEQDFVENKMDTLIYAQTIWTGLKEENAVFSWIDGAVVSYNNYAPDILNYQGACIAVFPSWKSYQWVRSNCPSTYYYMCKKIEPPSTDWTEWEQWSSCSCGVGESRTRTRACMDTILNTPSTGCPGNSSEASTCPNDFDCPIAHRHGTAILLNTGILYLEPEEWTNIARSVIDCSRLCLSHSTCVTFHYHDNDGVCRMFDHIMNNTVLMQSSAGWSLWEFYSRSQIYA